MTPQERLALALQYQKQRDLGSALPSTPAENAARPVREPEQSWLDKLSEIANGVGFGGQNLVEALGQIVRHPGDALHSFTVGVSKAMDNPIPAAQATLENVKQYAENAVSSPFNLGQAIGENISPRRLAAMLESPAVREIVAYHGTPHRFEPTEANPLGEFDASKIGTGEGAQVYGHGVYLAENPEVANEYRRTLRDINPSYDGVKLNDPIKKTAAELIIQSKGDKTAAIKAAERYAYDNLLIPEINKMDAAKVSYGSLYHADLPDEMIDRMLDWDKPLSEQPKAVQNIFGQLPRFQDSYVASKANAGEAYGELAGSLGSRQKASDALRQAGIPGIKYLDAGSRGSTGTGTRNFVVFPGEEKKVKILERK